MDLLLFGCCTRFSCTIIKLYSQLAKITISSIHILRPIHSPPTGWTNWPINEVNISKLNWRQIIPCHNIHVYSVSILVSHIFFDIFHWVSKCFRLCFLIFSILILFTSINNNMFAFSYNTSGWAPRAWRSSVKKIEKIA